MKELSLERLKEVIDYDPIKGIMIWKQDMTVRIKAGMVIIGSNKDSYLAIRIDGVRYKVHQLAWFYMTGCMPTKDIDHINNDRSDYRFSNLREVDRAVNLHNRKDYANNTSGFPGVYSRKGKFFAKLGVYGKVLWLGTFNTAEEAYQKYLQEKYAYFPKP